MILEMLKKRRSIRKFKDCPIEKGIIDCILEAGRLSPSGGNEQSWKFGLIDDKLLIHEISKIAYNQKWISSSPLLIVLCTDVVDDSNGAREIQKRRFPDYASEFEEMNKDVYTYLNLEEHQTKIPGTHMVLAALEKGVYSTWISYFDVKELQLLLNLKSDCIPSEIIAFGYPAEEAKESSKKNIKEIYFKNTYTEV